MEGKTLRIAVTVAPDFRLRAWPAGERVVRGHRAIRPNANDLAEMVGKVLRLIARGEMLAQRQEEIVVGCLRNPAAEMIAVGERPFLMKDHAHRLEMRHALVDEPGAAERGSSAPSGGLGETEIDGVILRVGAIEHHIVQSALPRRKDAWHSAERR